MKEFYLLKYNGKYVRSPERRFIYCNNEIVDESYYFNQLSFSTFNETYKYPTHDSVLNAMEQLVDMFKLDKSNFEFEHYTLAEP